jgi:hypothetical protein
MKNQRVKVNSYYGHYYYPEPETKISFTSVLPVLSKSIIESIAECLSNDSNYFSNTHHKILEKRV